MSLAIPFSEGTTSFSTGASAEQLGVRGDRRVDHHQPADRGTAQLGDPQRQAAAHRQAHHEDLVGLAAQLLEGPRRPPRTSPPSGSGSSPARSCRARAAAAADTVSPAAARYSAHGRSDCGLPVNPWHSSTPDRPAVMAERLRTWHHRHRLRPSSRRCRANVDRAKLRPGQVLGIDLASTRANIWACSTGWSRPCSTRPAGGVPALGRGHRERAARGAGHPGEQPPVVLRPLLRAAAAAAQGRLPGQGRVLHRPRLKGLVSKAFFSGVGADPGGPVRRRGQRAGAAHRAAGAGRRATCSASTPRAPGPPTAGCTAARPAWPGWRWRAGPR